MKKSKLSQNIPDKNNISTGSLYYKKYEIEVQCDHNFATYSNALWRTARLWQDHFQQI